MLHLRKLLTGALMLVSLGCRSATHTTTGAAGGAGMGALAGAVIGNRAGKPLQGAAIGGAAGGVIGGAAGAAQDIRENEEERVADEHYKQALAIAMKNEDVLQMLADGQSETVILSSVEKSITNFDLSPSGLAILKAAGASDAVILGMQNSLKVRRPVTMKSVGRR
ncbi:MAG TPA: hypothetical protein VM510_05130 [Caulifigura sp.]|nr:hypothetical protein [Caulifigura sp.]